MTYLYVFDYANARVLELTCSDKLIERFGEDAESILHRNDLNPDECSWMWSDYESDIESFNLDNNGIIIENE